MEDRRLSRYATGIVPLAVLSVLLALALFMMSAATQNSALFGHLYTLLVVVNVVGIALMLTVIIINVQRLRRQLRARVLGSRLTLRLLRLFALIAIVPVSVVYLFSIQLVNKGIDSWFDVRIEQALNDALLLGRGTLETMQDDLSKKLQTIALDLESITLKESVVLNDLREQFEIFELALFAADGRIIAASTQGGLGERQALVPDRPRESALALVRQGQTYTSVDSAENGLQLRVLVPVHGPEIGSPPRILQALEPVPARYSALTESIQSAFADYEKLLFLRKSVKLGFILTLTLVALLTLLVALWTALFFARRLVAPIRDLAEGTRSVAEGDYRKQIPVKSRDELGVLVKSFNEMTRKIHRAQSQIRRSQLEAEAQRTYLETVLTHLSSGVLSFDPRRHLRTYNEAAARILGIDLQRLAQHPLTNLSEEHAHLAPFVDAIRAAFERGRRGWQAEVVVLTPQGRRALMLRATRLPELDGRRGGYVVVFDDVTTLIQAQRDAAWGEVARRLAHEIKNPLTPIQLSAERIRHKCLPRLDEQGQETLDRATRTIIQQVEAMKSMVNEFADYARPVTHAESTDVNALIQDVVELYRGRQQPMAIKLELDREVPPLQSDPRRLRQVIHNLLLNAADALAGTRSPMVVVSTRGVREHDVQFAELKVCDNGPGFSPAVLDRLFEPYVTTKEKGTGLGLAIVRKIVEEHGGGVWAENRPEGGACVTLRLPVKTAEAGVRDMTTVAERSA